MARRRTDEWGVRFGISVNASGYTWQRLPDMRPSMTERTREVLAPIGQVSEDPPGRFVWGAHQETHHELGLGVAREAFTEFRKLAMVLDNLPSSRIRDGYFVEYRDGKPYNWTGKETEIEDGKRIREAIVAYANKFGLLWGDDDYRTIDDWLREAAEFLDLLDVCRALRQSRFTEIENRISPPQPGWNLFQYRNNQRRSRDVTIASEGDRMEDRDELDAPSTTTDFFMLAKTGTPRDRARMILSRQVNRKLSAGLSISASILKEQHAVVTPVHLVHLLYLRLWIDTINAKEPARECVVCGETIDEGNRNRKYCGDACKQRQHRRRHGQAA